MSSATHATNAPSVPRRAQRPPALDTLRDENVKLVDRVQRLRRALEAAAQENGQLRRDLARARAESQASRVAAGSAGSPPPAGADRFDRSAWIRVMLVDSHSRNP